MGISLKGNRLHREEDSGYMGFQPTKPSPPKCDLLIACRRDGDAMCVHKTSSTNISCTTSEPEAKKISSQPLFVQG